LTAIAFRDQAVSGIEAVRDIYQLRQPPRSPEDSRNLLVDRLLQSKLNVGDVRQVDRVISRLSGEPEPRRQTQVDLALDDLRAEYEEAAAMFRDLERLDFGSRQAVSQAVKPARNLTIKMLLLAKLLSQSPPTPRDPSRVAISVQLDALRQEYASWRTSEARKQEIRNRVDQLVDEWLRVDEEERALVCDAIAKVLRAAETGQKLSQLIDEYGQRRLEDILDEITRIVGTASSLTGRDYSWATTRLQTIDQTMNSNATLRLLLTEIVQRSPESPWFAASQIPPGSQLLQCQP
jgi:hypothetical protein